MNMTDYREKLLDAIHYWHSPVVEDEWYFEKFREECLLNLDSEDAFLLIDETIELLLLEKEESTACEILQTAINLAKHSLTTEVPKSIAEKKEVLEFQFLSYGDYAKFKLSELFRYYRLRSRDSFPT